MKKPADKKRLPCPSNKYIRPKGLLESFGTVSNVATVCNLLQPFGSFWNLLEPVGTFCNLLEPFGTLWNLATLCEAATSFENPLKM